MESNQILSQNVKMLRKEKKKNLEEFASESGVGRSTVQDIESGKANVTLDTVDTMAFHLGVSTLELLSVRQGAIRVLLNSLDKFASLSSEKQEKAMGLFQELLALFGGEV